MKTNVLVVVGLILFCVFIGCSDNKKETIVILEGDTKLIEIPQDGGECIVKSSQYPDWWLIGVYMQQGEGEKKVLYQMGKRPSSPAYYKGVVSGGGCTIQQDQESGNVICYFSPNKDKEDKTFYIHMEEHDFFPKIIVHQKGQSGTR